MILILSPVVYVYLVMYLLTTFSLFIFNSVFLVWFIMEVQIILFVSLAFDFSQSSVVGVVTYFLFQSVSSLGVLGSFYYSVVLLDRESSVFTLILLVFFLLNLGVYPFVGWYVFSVESMSLLLLVLVLTFQNLPGFVLLSCVLEEIKISGLGLSLLVILLLVFNVGYCSFMSFSSVSVILTFIWLSLASTFWIVLSLTVSIQFFLFYFLIYSLFVFCFMFSFVVNHYKFLNIISLLSLSGLPPFPDFFLKVVLVTMVFDSVFNYDLYLFLLVLVLVLNVCYMLSYVNLIINLLLNELVMLV